MYCRNDFLLNSSYIQTRAFQNKIHFETVFVYFKKHTFKHGMYNIICIWFIVTSNLIAIKL